MQQLLLNLSVSKTPSLNSFVTGKNEALMQILHQFAACKSEDRFAYIWGESAVGKTHLLQALASYPSARYIPATANQNAFAHDMNTALYLIDDCDKLDEEKQILAFNLFNHIRTHQHFLVSAGSAAPSHLLIRDDLKSRMSWGLVYQVHPLTDAEKIAALTHHASSRGMKLGAGVLDYLMHHYPRDMHALSLVLDALDKYSLATKRAATLPLLLDLLQKSEALRNE